MCSVHMVKVCIVIDKPLGDIAVDDISHLPQSTSPVKEDIAQLLWGHLALQDVRVVPIGFSVRNGGVNVRLHQIRVTQVPPIAGDVLQVQGGVKTVILWSE